MKYKAKLFEGRIRLPKESVPSGKIGRAFLDILLQGRPYPECFLCLFLCLFRLPLLLVKFFQGIEDIHLPFHIDDVLADGQSPLKMFEGFCKNLFQCPRFSHVMQHLGLGGTLTQLLLVRKVPDLSGGLSFPKKCSQLKTGY